MTHKVPPTFRGANGTLTINLGWKGLWRTLNFVGGPYANFPGHAEAFGVCVRAEQIAGLQMDAHLPIRDFSVPTDDDQVRGVLLTALNVAAKGRTVYVGCMGGWGRTGLFLALVCKAAGISDPVDYVRAYYTPHAVETDAQKRYVDSLDVSSVKRALCRRIWADKFPILSRLLVR